MRTMDEEKQLALQMLEDGAACVAVRGRQVLGSRSGEGLRPLYELTVALGDELRGAFVADLVIGQAAALLLIDHRVRGCFGRLMSDGAINLLSNAQIEMDWKERVPYIQARNAHPDSSEEERLCLMERLVRHVSKDEGVQRLRAVLSGQTPLSEYVSPKRNESDKD